MKLEIEKYGIKFIIQIISENGTLSGKPILLISHLDGEVFSYTLSEDNQKTNEIESKIERHINKCIREIRKEKLDRLNGRY